MTSTIRNLDVCLNHKIETNNRQAYSKINKLPNLFNAMLGKYNTSLQSHVLKWTDGEGHANLAFQLIKPNCNFIDEENLQNSSSYSLIFSFNSSDTMTMSIVQINTSKVETLTTNEDLGTFKHEELNEAFIIQKIGHFIESIAA